MPTRRVSMTEDEVRALPVAVDLPTAAPALGLGRTAAYELVRSGAWPTLLGLTDEPHLRR